MANKNCKLDPIPIKLLKDILPGIIGFVTRLINTNWSLSNAVESGDNPFTSPEIRLAAHRK